MVPILKSLGFGGSFYVCDFDSSPTPKDWYFTWRQMKSMADDGLEIGNHTKGQAGGAGIGPFLSLKDGLRGILRLLAEACFHQQVRDGLRVFTIDGDC